VIGDPVIIAQTMTARGIIMVLLATDGSRCAAGVVAHYQKYESITAENTVTAIRAILSFLRRSHEQKEAYHDQNH
jgi:hypothetical protein